MPAGGSSTVACPAAATAPTVPTVTDNCGRTLTPGAPVVSPDPVVQERRHILTPLPIVQVRATSGCILIPFSAPAVTMPASGSSTVACPAAATAPTVPTVTDNCGRTLTPGAPVVSPDPVCAGTKTYTYTFTDCAGQSYQWVYTYTISAPTVTMPAGFFNCFLSCTGCYAPTVPTVTDNCGRTLTPGAPVMSPDPVCAGTKTYTYTFTDCAGQSYQWVYTYTISAPAVTMPANGSSTVACPAAATAPTVPTVTDNCGRTLTPVAPVVSPDPVCAGTKTYTYTFTDCAGQSYQWVYTYTISAPVVTMPANGSSTVACPAAATAPTVPTVTDNCGRTLTPLSPVYQP